MNESGHDPADGPVTRRMQTKPRWWLIVTGVLLLGMPIIGTLGTVFGMISALESIATSSTTPQPADLAAGVRMSLIFTAVGLVLAVVGLVLIVVGIVFRRPVS